MVAHEQHDPVAGLKPAGAQTGSEARGVPGPLGVGGHRLAAAEDGGAIRVFQRFALQEVGEVHGGVSEAFSDTIHSTHAPDVPPLIDALLDPGRYPHPVDRVDLLQTHGAWVLLAGDRAYKIKKPVCLYFMDFSSLDRRRAACAAELRVNSRFAPAETASRIYLAALPITGTPQAPVIGGDPSQAIEWAVQMRRFPEADRLDHVAARGELTPAMLQALARHVAGFQARRPWPVPTAPGAGLKT
jgi:hypothetical protein